MEVARRAVVRAGVLAFLHVLQVEAVLRHGERGVQRERGSPGNPGITAGSFTWLRNTTC